MKETKTTYSYLIRHMYEPSFKKVRDLACDFVKKLPQELCDELYNLLNRGVTSLNTEPLLQMYFYAFGNMHEEKLNLAFKYLHKYVKGVNQIELIDYGCGQGLAAMCYHDYLKKENSNQEVIKITLIESSEIAIARAELLCEVFYPKAKIRIIQKEIDALEKKDLTTSEEILTIHLFSNILDVESFNVEKFAKLIKSISNGQNEYIIVSPMQNSRRLSRLKHFAAYLENNLYFEKYYDSREFNKNKDWTCAILLCSTLKEESIPNVNFDSIYLEAISWLKNRNRDYNRGIQLFQILNAGALSGNKKCQNGIGIFYKTGFCCEKSHSKAFEWFKKSADQKFPPAITNVADYYFYGKYVNHKYSVSVKLYKEACNLNYIPAYSRLGKCYLLGKGVEKDVAHAIELLEYATFFNDSLAQRLLGMLYIEGKRVSKDVEKGLNLLKFSASQNDKIAQRKLGDYYKKDTENMSSMSQAIKFYTMAGNLGDAMSILSLLEIFEKKDYKNLFKEEQFDLFLNTAKMGIYDVSRLTAYWSNREPIGSSDNVASYSSNGLRLIYTISECQDYGDEGFYTYKNVSSYKIKDDTRLISNKAFEDCKKLKHIHFPKSVNFIGAHAFHNCISLENVILPDSLIYIGDGAFDCEGHGFLLGDRCDKRKYPLQINIPQSIEIIDGNPFCQNSIIKCENKHFKVIDNVLYSADGKILISYCSTKTEFTIPNGVECIGKGAFKNVPIKKVQFPDSLQIIEKSAFENTKLEHVVFPESLKEIHEKAFEWCSFETGLISLPTNVQKIAHDAFGFGWYIKVIRVPKGRMEYYYSILPKWIKNQIVDNDVIYENGLYFNSDKTEIVSAYRIGKNITIPEGIIKIRDNAFASIYTIDSISFPMSLSIFSDKLFDKEAIIAHIYIPTGRKSYFKEKMKKYFEIIEEI